LVAAEKRQLFNNIKAAMDGEPAKIIQRQLVHFHRADPAYGAGVAKALDIDFKPEMVAAE
jgi:catalase